MLRHPRQLASAPLAAHWDLDPAVDFLNHGSFGACPRAVLACQAELRRRLEAEPVRFFTRELQPLLDVARAELATFVAADGDGLVLVTNATTGVNTALAAVPLAAGDEILLTDHGYGACTNAAAARAAAAGATLVTAAVPFPLASADEVVAAVLARVGRRTRLALLDHVTSPTGLVFPVARLAAALEGQGVTVIIDGAHAPGMVELEVAALGASFYTGNCHKWLCAPKGSAFLWVRPDWRSRTRPLVISHGATAPLAGRSRLHREFDWTGTHDPTPWLAIPAAIATVASLLPGGWPAVREHNRRLALAGRDLLCAALGVAPPVPDDLIGALAAVPLPGDGDSTAAIDPLQNLLFTDFAIEVPVIPWPAPGRRLLRIAAQLYNHLDQYRRLAAVVAEQLRPI